MNKQYAHVSSVIVLLFLFLLPSSAVHAAGADIYVDDNCTLANAIISANQDQALGGCEAGIDRDTIHLNADVTANATLPTITTIMVLDGNGHTISGNGSVRIFHVSSGSLALIDLTLANGFANGQGGAVLVDGGNLILNRSRITSSQATQTGGAISVDNGVASIGLGSVLEHNRAHKGGAVWVGPNGQLFSSDRLTIRNNSASGTGGGIHSMGRIHIIGPGSIERNTASGRGGGIISRGGNVIFEDSEFRVADNSAAGGGGISLIEGASLNAIYGLYVGNNRATNGGGGGIGVDSSTLALNHVTIEGNRAPNGGGIWGLNGNIAVDNTSIRDNHSSGAGYNIYAERSTVTVDGVVPVNQPGILIYP